MKPALFRRDLIVLLDLLRQEKIKPVIAGRFPLAEARQAQELLGKGGVVGKIVLLHDGSPAESPGGDSRRSRTALEAWPLACARQAASDARDRVLPMRHRLRSRQRSCQSRIGLTSRPAPEHIFVRRRKARAPWGFTLVVLCLEAYRRGSGTAEVCPPPFEPSPGDVRDCL